jgi:hypothetical protein
MIQTPRALGLGAFLLFLFVLHWFYTSVPEGTTFGLCPAHEKQDLEAGSEIVCPASCSKKNSDLDRYLDIQQLCSDPSNLNEATDQNGGESTGKEPSEEEVTETLVNTKHIFSDVETTGGPSNYLLGSLDGNLRDVMNETLGVSNSNTQLDFHANLSGTLVPKDIPCEPPRTS